MSHTLKFVPLVLALATSLPVLASQTDPTPAARQASMLLIKTLGGELKASMASGGPVPTISVCKEQAPKIAADLSRQTGMEIHRVSVRNRNPDGAPDAWEAEAITSLEKRLVAGEKPETLEMSAVVDGPKGKTFRYAKALVTQPVCLVCHGSPESIPAAVRAKIGDEYPNDKAVGYSAGMLRGIISVRRPL
jgi:hypothetical protein